jgi:beta-galactosidase
VAIAKRNGVEVARDVLRTAGAPSTLRLTPDKTVLTADGKSLAFVTVEVVDAQGPTADASFSGSPQTVPAAMLDGNKASGGWSNFYEKAATALLPAVSSANASDWVSLEWPQARSLDSVTAWFTTGPKRVLPASLVVSFWDGKGYVPVSNPSITWASASNQPTVISFDPVQTTELRLEMTSPAPGSATGFLQISELEVPVSR